MISLLQLIMRPGMEVKAEDWNSLVRYVQQITPLRTAGSRRRYLPGGVIVTTPPAVASNSITHAFSVAVDASSGNALTMSRGLIGGFEPTIQGSDALPISDPAAFIELPDSAFAPIGAGRFQALLYLCITVGPDFTIAKVEPEVRKSPPSATAWKTWKLVAFLQRDGIQNPTKVQQMLFLNQSFAATQTRSNGSFKAWIAAS